MQLISAFVFALAKSKFSHDVAHIMCLDTVNIQSTQIDFRELWKKEKCHGTILRIMPLMVVSVFNCDISLKSMRFVLLGKESYQIFKNKHLSKFLCFDFLLGVET